MSIVDTIKRRGRPPIPSGPAQGPIVKAKLSDAQAQLADVLAEYSLAALADAVGDPDGPERLATVKAQRAELEQRVEDLQLAFEAASEADQRQFAAVRASMYSTQIAAVRRNLGKRLEAAKRLDKAVEAAVSAWHDLYAGGRAAERANPIGNGHWPADACTTPKALGNVVRRHIRKLGGVHPATRHDLDKSDTWGFPGSDAVDGNEAYAAGLPNLVDEITRFNDHVMGILEGRTPVAPVGDFDPAANAPQLHLLRTIAAMDAGS
jgi:hypothetical protein